MDSSEISLLAKEIVDLEHEKRKIQNQNMPIFERGVAEASIERQSLIVEEIRAILAKNGIKPEVKMVMTSETVGDKDNQFLICTGVLTEVRFRVFPIDKKGNDGRYTDEQLKQIEEIDKKIKEINKKLDSTVTTQVQK